ncbi:Transcriptional regulator containing an AAA-type ATPase domain and a DNA-binding domain [Peptoclostridium litorale DSM 5388]|uniref:Transcriptional regulatory protein LevR n=1 Tax=Peptoclostridium litorale DSM 5388 TaxID=1121324 RepID=A0A069RI03_PEPLI
MERQLLKIIESENGKNPFKDEQLANMLGISRTKVNELRNKLEIPSYTERRNNSLTAEIENIIENDPEISIRQIVVKLNKNGFEISAYGLNRYREKIEEIKKKAVESGGSYSDCDKAFESIIGYSKSLKPAIKKGKAAALYPPNGLHALLVGETGSGKSSIVEALYKFTKCFKRDENMPFILFNCADYSENPQLLVSELFGHARGSFTGAESDKPGLVEMANGGILFLDEIHRLPPKGQEILFSIIDRGVFSRLGEKRRDRKASLMIIGATTENVESTLLMTFRRRIPFLIQIPPLSQRPVLERFEIIQLFFSMESNRVNMNFYIPRQITKALLFYNCPGNIGQLKSDIQVTCAQAYIDSMDNEYCGCISIETGHLPSNVQDQLHEIDDKVSRQMQIVVSDLFISSGESSCVNIEDCIFKENIYRIFESDKTDDFKDVTTSRDSIGYDHRHEKFKRILEKVDAYLLDIENRYSSISDENLKAIVGERVSGVVEKALGEIAQGISSKTLRAVVSLHISIAMERISKRIDISNPFAEDIKHDFNAYYEMSRRMIQHFINSEGLEFPEAECAYIALILNYFARKSHSESDSNVGVLVAGYGDVSKSLVSTAREFLGVDYGSYIQLELNEDSSLAISKMKSAIELADNGKGVVILVDMEPLLSYCEIIASEYENKIKTIPRVDTPMVIEAIHKALIPYSTVDEIYHSILKIEKSLPYKLLNRDDIKSISSVKLE